MDPQVLKVEMEIKGSQNAVTAIVALILNQHA
jgi:hypothetical protein